MPSLQPRFRPSSLSLHRVQYTHRVEPSGWISRRGLAGTREAATTTTAGNASRRETTAVATRTVRTTVRGRFHRAYRQSDEEGRLTETFLLAIQCASAGGQSRREVVADPLVEAEADTLLRTTITTGHHRPCTTASPRILVSCSGFYRD